MKERVLGFLKPRAWTVIFTIILVAWQYVWAYRGEDIAFLSQLHRYFGSGLTVISWDNFFIRTVSLGIIWVIVALGIFGLLWLAETYVVGSHNRRISRNYANQPRAEYIHLLRDRNISFKIHFISYLWLSAFVLLIPLGLIYATSFVEIIRANSIISYVVMIQDSGSEVDYNNVSIAVISFIAMLPIWYIYACFDRWCLSKSQSDDFAAKIEDDHYSIPVVAADPETDDDDFFEESDGDSNIPSSPVI